MSHLAVPAAVFFLQLPSISLVAGQEPSAWDLESRVGDSGQATPPGDRAAAGVTKLREATAVALARSCTQALQEVGLARARA